MKKEDHKFTRRRQPYLMTETSKQQLDRILDAYETFAHVANTRALRVIIEA